MNSEPFDVDELHEIFDDDEDATDAGPVEQFDIDDAAGLETVDLEDDVGDVAPLPSQRVYGGQRSSRRRRPWGWVAALGALILAALGVWGWLAYDELTGVRDGVTAARSDLIAARDALTAGELPAAEARFASASQRLAEVPDALSGPTVAPVRLIATYRRTLDAVGDLALAATLVSDAGGAVTAQLDAGDGGLGALAPTDGRIPVDALADLAPVLEEAAEDVAAAQAIVLDVPSSGIDAQVRDARAEFLALLEPAEGQLRTASGVAEVLPALFGAEGPRRYLVVASNPTEARGTGGFFGAYLLMDADDGQLSFTPTTDLYELPSLPRGTLEWPDESLEERYDIYGGSGFLPNINMTPDFPSAATLLENYFRESQDSTLDGVLAIDPFAFESLLRISGPVELEGLGQIDADNVVEFVSHGAYSELTDPDERKRLIGAVAQASLQGFLANPGGTSASVVISSLAEMVARQSLLVYASDSEEQAIITELGLAGRLSDGDTGDFLGIFLNSGASYKIDYFLQRTVDYDVVLGPDGVAVSTLLTGFDNQAVLEGEPGYMIGFGDPPLDVGDALSFISVYCAPGCDFFEVPDNGFEGLETEEGIELGHPVRSTWMLTPAGQSRQLAWSYQTPDAWTSRGADRVYTLRYRHQTTIRPVELHVTVAIPDGFEASELPEGASVEDGAVDLRLDATRDLDLQIVFSPVPA
ncbi:DUF4012 domain-containing protein [Euzebya tangerina]|uniref:DUF4012 domain-containing protein n=1 Tax=Euzebya tangerina TaxID=591198 RepID=UPI000E31B6F6|nr:DUF4012 domain-containing protein [Euzebya tangerina]